MLFERQVTDGMLLDSNMLFADLVDRWFKEYANKQLGPQTLYNYRSFAPRILTALGHMKVSKIKPAHLMAFYDNLEEEGVRQDSTFTATAALLKLLPHGIRGEMAKKAGIGQDTMRLLYAGNVVTGYHINPLGVRQVNHDIEMLYDIIGSRSYPESFMKYAIFNLQQPVRAYRFQDLGEWLYAHLNQRMEKKKLYDEIMRFGYFETYKDRNLSKDRLNMLLRPYDVRIVSDKDRKRCNVTYDKTLWLLEHI